MRLRRAWGAALLVLSTMALGACEPAYDGIAVQRVGGSLQADVSGSEMSVPEGALVIFEPQLRARRGEYDALDEVDFQAHDDDVARVLPGLRAGTWMLLGATAGSTAVDVFVNGELEDTISVRVTFEEASS